MYYSIHSRSGARMAYLSMVSVAAVSAVLTGGSAIAQQPNPTKKAGPVAVELRIPTGGLFAQEETDVEFRVTDTSKEDAVLGAAPIVNAKIAAHVSMPAMPSMPAQAPKTHSEGVPGDYGVVLFLPHGGDYQLDLDVTPPGGKLFTVSFKLPVGDANTAKGRKARIAPFVADLSTSEPPEAGKPASLRILIRRTADHSVVTQFDTVHEQKMHLIIVSKDLSFFAHEHPDSNADGSFTHRFTFPSGGMYQLFADTAPKDAGSQVLVQTLKVSGAPAVAAPVLDPSATDGHVVDGMRVKPAWKTAEIPSGRSIPLTFTLENAADGSPIMDIQPWLGAIAHLILIQQDAATFVHCHPDESDPTNGHDGRITFNARLPKPGLYRGWMQFQRGGVVHTATFVVRAGVQK